MNTQDLDTLLERISEGTDLDSVRSSLLDQLEVSLERHGTRLERWHKDHLAVAISAFQWNLNHRQGGNWWLRYCLLNIWKADLPKDRRSEYPSARDEILDGMFYQDFKSGIEALRVQMRTT